VSFLYKLNSAFTPKGKFIKYGYNNWNEGLHSFLRSKLAMLKRKTKAYAKSFRALYRALALVFIRWNLLSTF